MPADLPSIADARLPATYTAAKLAMAECSRIDECADWAAKAEALASYAKQAGDEALHRMADRIQARAIRRCGELLREIAPKGTGGRPVVNGVGVYPISRREAAEDAGLSRHQKRTALRVANVPSVVFEDSVESSEPPSVTKLAEMGKRPAPLIDLEGRDNKEFSLSTRAQGQLDRFVEMTESVSPIIAIRGAFPNEIRDMLDEAHKIIRWLEDLIEQAKVETL